MVHFFNLAWDQSDKFVKIYLTDIPNVQTKTDLVNDFEFKVDLKTVRFVAKNLNGKNYVFEIHELADKITPEKCEFKVKSGKSALNLIHPWVSPSVKFYFQTW